MMPKKLIFILLYTTFLFSCQKGDVLESDSKIIGSWKFHFTTPNEVITADDFITQSIEQTIKNNSQEINWKFYKNGKAYGSHLGNVKEYSYRIKDNKVQIFFKNNLDYTYEYSCIDNKLILLMDETERFKQECALLEDYYNPEMVKIDISKVITTFIYIRGE